MSIFDELREKYNRLYYPNTGEKQFETFKNLLKKDILNSEFEQARMEYQNILSNRGLNRSSIDATTGGEQQQIVTNPITGATEIITPEYNRQFRTDETDFMPGGSELFRNIYDEDLGSIDPITGEVKEIENIIDTGLISDSNKQQGGNGPNQQDNQKYSYETFNGKSYRVNNFTGEVEEADLPFGTATFLGGLINKIPGVEDYRFENLPLNTQEQINNLVANDPNSLRNAQGINKSVRKVFGVDLNSNFTNEFNQAQGLTTPAGLLNRPVNLNITPQDLSLFGGIPTTATERLNITDAEKERQAREARNARPAKVDANKARQLRDRNMGKGTDRSGTGNYGGGYQGGR